LNSIDRLAIKAIDNKMTPGTSGSLRGKIIFEKIVWLPYYEKRFSKKNSIFMISHIYNQNGATLQMWWLLIKTN
jgi:hypothetical protein